MLTLYHWEPNSNSLEVLAALHEKAIPFESRYVDFLKGETWRELFAATTEVECNIEIEGPVLVTDSGVALTDSYFINQYLDDAYPQKQLRPADAEGRWRINVWARLIGEDFTPAINTLGVAKYLTPRIKDDASIKSMAARLPGQERRDAWLAVINGHSAEAQEDAKRKVAILLKRAEDALGKGPYLLGDAFGLADLCLYAQANALRKVAPDAIAAAPKVSQWLDRVRGRDALVAAMKHARTAAPDESFAPGAEPSRWG